TVPTHSIRAQSSQLPPRPGQDGAHADSASSWSRALLQRLRLPIKEGTMPQNRDIQPTQPHTTVESAAQHSSPPVGNKQPLKVNVFERLQSHVSQLAPLFPYLDDEAIVPATALFVGHEGFRPGRFSHFNTVEEVALVLAAAGGYIQGANL